MPRGELLCFVLERPARRRYRTIWNSDSANITSATPPMISAVRLAARRRVSIMACGESCMSAAPSRHRLRGGVQLYQWSVWPWASSSSLMTGGTSKVWNGAGDGTVHYRPLAPSHTRSVAFFFEPHTAWISTPTKISCEAPNRKPPIELIMLKLANATL